MVSEETTNATPAPENMLPTPPAEPTAPPAEVPAAPAEPTAATVPERVPEAPAATPPAATPPAAEAPADEDEPSDAGAGDFAALLHEEDQKNKAMKQGTKVLATIERIDGETTLVNVGSKMDGIVDTIELKDNDGNLLYKPGDEVELYIVTVGESEIKLSRALQGQAGKWAIRDAFTAKIPVQGRVKEVVKGGYSVTILGQRAFCPMSHMDTRFVAEPQTFVGQTLTFKITKFSGSGRRVDIVVSRLDLLRELERENFSVFEAQVAENPVVKGRVTRLEPFGMFVELMPGIEGMCHVSEICWSRLDHPNQRHKPGDEVTVKVKRIEKPVERVADAPAEEPEAKDGDKKAKRGRRDRAPQARISLTIKELLPHPWSAVTTAFKKGDVVRGRITKLMTFGAFVEITDGVEGLVHVSELSYERRINKPEDVVKAGEEVQVKILDIDTEKQKISLSLRQAGVDPWAEARSRFPVGGRVNGTVEKREKFGWFVNLAPGFTGLLPQSKVTDAPNAQEYEKLRPGDTVSLVVIDLNERDRKITLAPELNPEDDWKRFSQAAKENTGGGGMSQLAEALLKQMKEKGLGGKN